LKKNNSDENSEVQKVWNWINCEILQNSEWISQPRLEMQKCVGGDAKLPEQTLI
jgi:hypothetical protein